ncbi:conserved exported hypothetical protein [Syntrophobacter sp. SbD1]|nr:conserved exported hypothetical protein [Syntrophobacter sp. SbD1]
MRHFKIVVASIVIMGLGMLMPLSGICAQDSGATAQPGSAQRPADKPVSDTLSDKKEGTQGVAEVPVYNPPLRGAPGRRVAGGTRGNGDGLPGLSVLAPDHVGLTAQEQPSLYWLLSGPANCPIEFTIIEAQAVQPLLEVRIKPAVQMGLQCIRLADYGLRLKTGVQYGWFVTLVPDPDRRSKDVVAGGVIERVDLSGGVRAKLDQAGKKNAPFVYAEAGLWYDAISAVSDLAAAAPGDAVVRKQRMALLRQVGLPDVVEYDMKQ